MGSCRVHDGAGFFLTFWLDYDGLEERQEKFSFLAAMFLQPEWIAFKDFILVVENFLFPPIHVLFKKDLPKALKRL